ncbi:MAG: LacI family DNA-binding transcriptional regulator [Candidatus Galacturonibacter soehngenii]|nr:LacI family DNA-binding transcriptional regulator [Candidatus Galacturonibacter soehngenii]
MSISAKELAKLLNLSEAAVSMALNNKPGVSTKTRQLVLEMAEKHGYDFTRISWKNNVTGSILFVIFRKHGAVVKDSPFFSELFEGIENGCKKSNYKYTISYINESEDLESQLEHIIYSDYAGIILLGTEMQMEDLKPFLKINIPMVLLDVYFDLIKHDCILINNMQGAFLATDYLISRTNCQPGYLHSAYSIHNFESRSDGFYKAIRKHGMSTSKSIVHKLTPSIDGAYADMLELLEQKEEIAPCYFADNDLIAIGAMKAFQKMGYKIPEDVAIVGFDNLPMTSYIEPSLTTIHVPKQYMGEMAASRLIEIIHAKNFVPIKLEVSTSLIKRRSI